MSTLPTIFASIFTAAKRTGAKWELVIHQRPGISGDSVIGQYYFQSKPEAKRAALAMGAKAWNYYTNPAGAQPAVHILK